MTTESDCQKAFAKCKVVLLDVAGTTTSLTFIKETLFLYVKENIESFLKEHWEAEDIKTALKDLNNNKDVEDIDSAIQLVKDVIDKESTNSGLKTINGLVYKKGFEDGTLKAHVYSDVVEALNTWSKDRKIAIYSTGSVESQKLLFKHTVEGDISSNVSKYFDQSVGLKTESESYLKIVKELNIPAEEVMWISDLKEELKAGKEAGLSTILITRDSEADTTDYLKIKSFTELTTDSSTTKRKIEDDTTDLKETPPTKISKIEISEIISAEDKTTTDVKKEDIPEITKNGESEVTDKMEIKDTDKTIIPEEQEKSESLVDSKMEVDSDTTSLTDTNASVGQEVPIEKMEIDKPIQTETEAKNVIDSTTCEEKLDKPVECKAVVNEDSGKTAETNGIEIPNENSVEMKDLEKTETTSTNNEEPTQTPGQITEVTSVINSETISENNVTTDKEEKKEIEKVAVLEIKLNEEKSQAGDTNSVTTIETSKCDNTAPEVVSKSENNEVEEDTVTSKDTVVCETVENVKEVSSTEQPDTSETKEQSDTSEENKEDNKNTNEVTADIVLGDAVVVKETTVEKCNDNQQQIIETAPSVETETKPSLDSVEKKTEVIDKLAEVTTSTIETITNGKEMNGKTNGNCEIDTAEAVTNGKENDKTSETELKDEVKVKKIETNAESTTISIEA